MSHSLSSVTFVEKAQREVELAPVLPGEAEANELLARARQKIYYWPAGFTGFSARLSLRTGDQVYGGQLLAPNSKRFSLKWDLELPKELQKWCQYQVGELLAHREAPEVSKMASKSGVRAEDEDKTYGIKLVFEGDKMNSFYRVKDDRIRQIGRSYGSHFFVINIDTHHDFEGRFAAFGYNAFYWDNATKEFAKCETYLDFYAELGGIQVPSERRYSLADSQGLDNRSLGFEQLSLL